MTIDLDDEFGLIRLPEKVDVWEKGRTPASKSLLDENVAKRLKELERIVQCDLLRPAARAKNYIWAMDEGGAIYIAVEELELASPETDYSGYPRRRGCRHPSEEKKLGHPTLLDAAHARIAGELAFDEQDNKLRWVLNANSGRYCRQKPPTDRQIRRVAEQFRELGVDVDVDYD
jgi:hypothetical protein